MWTFVILKLVDLLFDIELCEARAILYQQMTTNQNQPTDQLNNQPTDQPTNEPTNQPNN